MMVLRSMCLFMMVIRVIASIFCDAVSLVQDSMDNIKTSRQLCSEQ